MSALKYWNGSEWVTLPDIGAKQVWTGPDAPVPIGDHRLWIDTDEPDPALVGSNAWSSNTYAAATAASSGWIIAPIPVDASFIKNGDSNAFVRNADGSLTIRDAGVYIIDAAVQVVGAAATEAKAVVLQKGVSVLANIISDFLTQAGIQVTQSPIITVPFVGYLPAGQVISVLTYVPSGYARQVLHFSIARIGTGPAGPPGPPGPSGLINVQKIWGTANAYLSIASGGTFTIDGTNLLRLNYTPPVNVWWEVDAHIGNLQCLTAAYVYAQPAISCSPADADGQASVGGTRTQHSQVNQFEPWPLHGLFKLVAGVAYSTYVTVGFSGGSWNYYSSANQLVMTSKAWAR